MSQNDMPDSRLQEPWANYFHRLYAAGVSMGRHDSPSEKIGTVTMNDVPRDELNAKLETIEIKMDARVEAIASKIDGFLVAQSERDKRLDESIACVRRDIDRLGSLKLNIWGAMLTAVALGVTVAALSVTVYQTGKGDIAIAPLSPLAIEVPGSVHIATDE